MISFTCSCGKRYSLKEKYIGQKIRCSDCGSDLTVPRESELELSSDLPTGVMPLKPRLEPQEGSSPSPSKGGQAGSPQPSPHNRVSSPAPSSPQKQSSPFAEEEYYIISNNAPELLNDYAVQPLEDTGPPSEALSVILGRAAVQEHMLNIGDTLGVHPTPVPVGTSKRRERGSSGKDMLPNSILGLNTDEPRRPVLEHAPQKSSNPIVFILVAIIIILVIGILVLLLGTSRGPGQSDADRQNENTHHFLAATVLRNC